MGTVNAVFTPLSGPCIIHPLRKGGPMRTIGIVLLVHGKGAIIIEFVRKVLAVFKEIPPQKIEIIIVNNGVDERAAAKARYLINRHQSVYFMQMPHIRKKTEALFRAWQRSRARILGCVDVGDTEALTIMSAMLAKGRNFIQDGIGDVVLGYRKLLGGKISLHACRLWARMMMMQMCGRLIMPDLFRSNRHPFSTCLFVRRGALEEREMFLHGDLMLPNLIAHIPDMRISELPYTHSAVETDVIPTQKETALHALIFSLFQLNVFYRTYIALSKANTR